MAVSLSNAVLPPACRWKILEPTLIALTFDDLIVQKLPATPLNPEQSFVAWNAFVSRGVWSREEATDAENPRAASKTPPAASARTLVGKPVRPAIEASFARGRSVTD